MSNKETISSVMIITHRIIFYPMGGASIFKEFKAFERESGFNDMSATIALTEEHLHTLYLELKDHYENRDKSI
jgi:hypothetical protein